MTKDPHDTLLQMAAKDLFPGTRPYHDSEIPAAIARVSADPLFEPLVSKLFPDTPVEQFRQEFLRISTIDEFQDKVMLKAIWSIVRKTCTDFTWDGFDNLDNNHRYMFVANHRDILLDAALLQIVLKGLHLRTSEITFGDNLMQGNIVIDIGKMNKMFRIVRGGAVHDFYRNSMEVSSYMRYALLEKGESVWIAQRNGRTKDGNDKTESAVLKMFSISSRAPFTENLGALNITPVAISYEYEPCDFLKAQELYVSQYQKYIKEPGEDRRSILQGIIQPKGRVRLSVTPTITTEELAECDRCEKNLKFERLARIIDQRIYSHYSLWKTNYMAHDLLTGANTYRDRYTPEELGLFEERLQSGLAALVGDRDELRSLLLKIYATPIDNKTNKDTTTQTAHL